jgi:hypothetical protein
MSYCGAPIKNPVVRPCVLNQSRAFEEARQTGKRGEIEPDPPLGALVYGVPDVFEGAVARRKEIALAGARWCSSTLSGAWRCSADVQRSDDD